MRPLRVVVTGSVDDGKSTLLGRLMHDAQWLYRDEVAAVRKASPELNLAFFTDGLRVERERGITLDVATRHLTLGGRRLLLADVPGHEGLIANMATGASTADAAVLLVDAERGVQPQTRRHLAMLSGLGVERVVVCLNKMDSVGFSAARARELEAEVRAVATVWPPRLTFTPLCARTGDNVVTRSVAMPWFEGATLSDTLGQLEPRTEGTAFRGVVQLSSADGWVALHSSGGALSVADTVHAHPDGGQHRVLEVSPKSSTRVRFEGTLARGTLMTLDGLASVASQIPVIVTWISHQPFNPEVRFVQHGRTTRARVEAERMLEAGAVSSATLALEQPTWFDRTPVSRLTSTGLLIDEEGHTVAGVRVP